MKSLLSYCGHTAAQVHSCEVGGSGGSSGGVCVLVAPVLSACCPSACMLRGDRARACSCAPVVEQEKYAFQSCPF